MFNIADTMETLVELKRITDVLLIGEKDTIFQEKDEFDIAALFEKELYDKLFSLPHPDFIVPYLKQLTSSCNIRLWCYDFDTCAGTIVRMMRKEENSIKVLSLSRKENLVWESFKVFNSLLGKIFYTCDYFGIDGNIILEYNGFTKYIDEEYFHTRGYRVSDELPQPQQSSDSISARFTHKQQILLLHKLGFFDLPAIDKLTDLKKGKLFALLLSKNIDNTENLIRYRRTQKKGEIQSSYYLYDDKNVEKVNELLKELGIEK